MDNMTMDVGEFIDAYSDDVIYLHEARCALRTHPLRGDYAFAEYLDASFCRMLTVFIVGAIEAMLQSWRDRDRVKVLETYFRKNASNRDRVSALYEAFRQAGIPVDKEIFDDYLAIKYLRNTIVHGRWRDEEKEWLDARGFPTDTRKLTKEHLDKIEHVYQNMMFYIFLTTVAVPDASKPRGLFKLHETVTRRVDETGILRLRDIDRIIWNNLERIDYYIYLSIEKVVVTEQYNWSKGYSYEEILQLSDQERKILFYRAVWRAAKDGHPLLSQHRDLAKEALQFWREYWQRAVVSSGLHEERIQRALRVFQSPEFKLLLQLLPPWLVLKNLSDEDACSLLDRILPANRPFQTQEIIDALQAGHLAYELIRNITPVTLFTVRLPFVDPEPENVTVYFQEAERALQAFRLNRWWYSCVEHRRALIDESLNFYDQIRQELTEAL